MRKYSIYKKYHDKTEEEYTVEVTQFERCKFGTLIDYDYAGEHYNYYLCDDYECAPNTWAWNVLDNKGFVDIVITLDSEDGAEFPKTSFAQGKLKIKYITIPDPSSDKFPTSNTYTIPIHKTVIENDDLIEVELPPNDSGLTSITLEYINKVQDKENTWVLYKDQDEILCTQFFDAPDGVAVVLEVEMIP